MEHYTNTSLETAVRKIIQLAIEVGYDTPDEGYIDEDTLVAMMLAAISVNQDKRKYSLSCKPFPH